jgi:hypothetical protein
LYNLLLKGRVGSNTGVVDVFTEQFEQLFPVVIEVSIHFINCSVLDDPEGAAGVSNEALVVAHDNNT